MHILFVTAEYPPMPGGVGAYTAELSKALTALGCQVSIMTSQSLTSELQGEQPAVYTRVTRWDWRILRAVEHTALSLAVDWVHVQYQTGAYAMHPAINLAPWWWGRKWGGARRARFYQAWTYHDLRVPYLFPKAGERLRRWITVLPAMHSDLVVVTNEGDRVALARQSPNLAKIPIGSNIVGRRFTPTELTQRRAHHGFGADEVVVGYFGFLNRSKGGLALVRTLNRLVQQGRNAHLLMIGEQVGTNDPTNFAYLQEVQALVDQLGLAGRVRWTGRQPDVEVSADLSLCDVLLMPYLDGASLRRGTLMAGLVHGCAIITTTPQAPLPELVDGRDLLYVPIDDDQAMTAAVLRIVDQPALAAVLRQQARAVSAQFQWEEIARQHLHWYQRQTHTHVQTPSPL